MSHVFLFPCCRARKDLSKNVWVVALIVYRFRDKRKKLPGANNLKPTLTGPTPSMNKNVSSSKIKEFRAPCLFLYYKFLILLNSIIFISRVYWTGSVR